MDIYYRLPRELQNMVDSYFARDVISKVYLPYVIESGLSNAWLYDSTGASIVHLNVWFEKRFLYENRFEYSIMEWSSPTTGEMIDHKRKAVFYRFSICPDHRLLRQYRMTWVKVHNKPTWHEHSEPGAGGSWLKDLDFRKGRGILNYTYLKDREDYFHNWYMDHNINVMIRQHCKKCFGGKRR